MRAVKSQLSRGVCAVAIFGVAVSGTKTMPARIPTIPKPYCPIQAERADDFPRNRQSRPTLDTEVKTKERR